MALARSLAVFAFLMFLVTAAGGSCSNDDTTTTGDGDGDGDGDIDAAGAIDAPGGNAAEAFCTQYEQTCGYNNNFQGNPYTDENDCVNRFNAYSASRKACVQQHLGFAQGGMQSTHCPHAEGETECA